MEEQVWINCVITSYSIHYTKLYDAATHSYGGSGYSIESKESPWAKGNVSTAIDIKEGYYPSQPKDTLETFRKDVCDDLYNNFGVITSYSIHYTKLYDPSFKPIKFIIALANFQSNSCGCF